MVTQNLLLSDTNTNTNDVKVRGLWGSIYTSRFGLIPFLPQSFLTVSYSAAMEEHRATCEKEGRYVEAEMAKNRIAELKEQEFNRA